MSTQKLKVDAASDKGYYYPDLMVSCDTSGWRDLWLLNPGAPDRRGAIALDRNTLIDAESVDLSKNREPGGIRDCRPEFVAAHDFSTYRRLGGPHRQRPGRGGGVSLVRGVGTARGNLPGRVSGVGLGGTRWNRSRSRSSRRFRRGRAISPAPRIKSTSAERWSTGGEL